MEHPAQHRGFQSAAASEDYVDCELLKAVEVFFGHGN
jgi:hypothetical protein